MRPGAWVKPLEEPWMAVLDAVLRRRGAPTLDDTARLGPRLAELSRAYNTGAAGQVDASGAVARAPLEARIAFSFARDVPKGAGAVRELLGAGAFPVGDGEPSTLRIVDLGAGLGAMTWGVARALGAAGVLPAAIDALLVDDDADVLAAADALASEARARLEGQPLAVSPAPSLRVRTRRARVATGMELPVADLVLVGQVLSELELDRAPEERAERHAALLADLLDRVVAPGGALVVIEPALRERTRHLHAVRDRLVAAGRGIFAPCLHDRACPALTVPGDWCHEDLLVDLPPWLVPLARSAGLRYQGLTFAYLVLRRDGRHLSAELEGGGVRFRVVSDLIRTKGKCELYACTDEGARPRLRLLDRDAARAPDGGAGWAALSRGDVVTLRSAGTEGAGEGAKGGVVDDRGRVAAAVAIDVWQARK